MSTAINVADRETVAGYVRNLEELGLIKATRRGGFAVKVAGRRASEWTLTMFPVGEELATKDFMRWPQSKISGTEKPACKDGKTVPAAANDVRTRSTGTENPSHKASPEADPGTETRPHIHL
jgi:hypothetical protein